MGLNDHVWATVYCRSSFEWMNAASGDDRGADQDGHFQEAPRFRIGLDYTDGHESNNVVDFKINAGRRPRPGSKPGTVLDRFIIG